MKTRFHVKLLSTALLSLWLTSGCADQSTKSEAAASQASPEATAAIANANDAIAIAKSNDGVWRDTEKVLGQAKAAAEQVRHAIREEGLARRSIVTLDNLFTHR